MSNIGKRRIYLPNNLNVKIINYNKYKQLIISSSKNLSSTNLEKQEKKNEMIKYINFPSYFHLQISSLDSNLKRKINSFPLLRRAPLCRSGAGGYSHFLEIKGAQNNLRLSKGDEDYAFFGTLNSLISQMIQGFVQPFKKKLVLNGIGYKMEIDTSAIPHSRDKDEKQKFLKCIIGFSHPVYFKIPFNIEYKLLNSNNLEFRSNSLQDLTQFINKIVQIKPAYKDKYKKKGFEILSISSSKEEE